MGRKPGPPMNRSRRVSAGTTPSYFSFRNQDRRSVRPAGRARLKGRGFETWDWGRGTPGDGGGDELLEQASAPAHLRPTSVTPSANRSRPRCPTTWRMNR